MIDKLSWAEMMRFFCARKKIINSSSVTSESNVVDNIRTIHSEHWKATAAEKLRLELLTANVSV